MLMLLLLLGLILTTVLFARAEYARGPRMASMGTMSHQWIAAHQASQHASSM
jgi:nicotinic acid phosphoribosyltransferase